METPTTERDEFIGWRIFLNEVIGIFWVGGAIAALGAKKPTTFAITMILCGMMISFIKYRQFKTELFLLSMKLRKSTVEKYNFESRYNHFSQQTDISCTLYVIGVLSIVAVIVLDYLTLIPAVKEFIGI